MALWDADSARTLATLRADEAREVEALEFSPDGRWLAVLHRRAASEPAHAGLLWDVAQRRPAQRFEAGRSALAFSPDSAQLATVHRNAIQILDTTPAGGAGGAGKPRRFGVAGAPHALAFSADGRRLAAGGRGFAARIWEMHSGRHLADTPAQLGPVFSLTFAPDGKTLVTAGVDGAVRFWETTDWHELMTLSEPAGSVGRLMFSPQGRFLAVGGAPVLDGRAPVRLWPAAGFDE